MNKMEYNGNNAGLNSNPESLSRIFGDLHVYGKRQHHGNTTPAGVEQPMVVLHFYKHLILPAFLLPLNNRGRLLKAERVTIHNQIKYFETDK